MNPKRNRIWTTFEDGSGVRYTVSLNFPIFAASTAAAEAEFKKRMVRGDAYEPRWGMDFDLTREANGMRDRIDMVWIGTATAEPWPW
jgi:hypothetical protein